MKILLIIIVIYFLLILAGRYIFPYVIRYYTKRFSRKFYEGMNNQYQNDPHQKEGEIHIDQTPEINKSRTTDIGEYVDYEEIK